MENTCDFLVAEDQVKSAESYCGLLRQENVARRVDYTTSASEAIKYISDPERPNKYLVDINFGGGRELEGLDILRSIKQHCPEALVFVYTAHDVREACEDVGLENMEFFTKHPTRITDHFTQMKGRSIEFNKHQDEPAQPETYTARIAHINREGAKGWIKLIFHLENGEEVEKIVPFRPVWLALDRAVAVNDWVKVTIIEEDTSLRYKYEKDSDPNPGRAPFTGLSGDRFIKSKFWGKEDQ
jgi:CheY-like chemotaxis protein